MYNPSRGGVRGGADQFTWESVKGDKHRENYLGHSLMAPVGRWQKGKDLSWYAKGRKDDKTQEAIEKSEFASIKKAEEEAMLIALGHNIVKKTQSLTKEDMREALKRNTERDDLHIERIDGVGATSQRIASLSGVRKDRQNNEGVAFETVRTRNISENDDKRDENMLDERKKNKKKSKKHKKEKKHKKHKKELLDSESSDDSSKYNTKHKKSKSDDADKKVLKVKHSKKYEHKRMDYSSDSDSPDDDGKFSKLKNHKTSKPKGSDHADFYSSDNENSKSLKLKSHKKSKFRYQGYSSDSDSQANVVQLKTKHKKSKLDCDDKTFSKEKKHKKSKLKRKDYSSDEISPPDFKERDHKRHEKQNVPVKRRRHDTSESD